MASLLGQQPNGKKVLIVDDDAVILKTTAMKLEAQGYEVVVAKDASGAIRAARKERPDLILMDVSFPPDVAVVSWDGFRIMSWLSRLEQTKDIPIIVMTGGQTGNFRDQAAVSGAVAFFSKPLDHQVLLQVIAQVVDRKTGKEPGELGVDFQI